MARRTAPREHYLTQGWRIRPLRTPPEPSMLVTYVDRCASCACSSLRDEAGQRPLPGVVGCGRTCKCHAPLHGARAATASLAQDAARFRFWRRSRAAGGGLAAIR